MPLVPSQVVNKMQISRYLRKTFKSKTLKDKWASGLSVSKTEKFTSGQSIPVHCDMIPHSTGPDTLLPFTN